MFNGSKKTSEPYTLFQKCDKQQQQPCNNETCDCFRTQCEEL